jgi:hypothetical protein
MKLRTLADSSRGAKVQNPSASHLLAPGKNCWRVEDARRARLLVDGAAYFAALRQVMAAALSDPSPLQITVLVIVLLSIALGAVGIHRWLVRRERSARERDAGAA